MGSIHSTIERFGPDDSLPGVNRDGVHVFDGRGGVTFTSVEEGGPHYVYDTFESKNKKYDPDVVGREGAVLKDLADGIAYSIRMKYEELGKEAATHHFARRGADTHWSWRDKPKVGSDNANKETSRVIFSFGPVVSFEPFASAHQEVPLLFRLGPPHSTHQCKVAYEEAVTCFAREIDDCTIEVSEIFYGERPMPHLDNSNNHPHALRVEITFIIMAPPTDFCGFKYSVLFPMPYQPDNSNNIGDRC